MESLRYIPITANVPLLARLPIMQLSHQGELDPLARRQTSLKGQMGLVVPFLQNRSKKEFFFQDFTLGVISTELQFLQSLLGVLKLLVMRFIKESS